MASEGVACLADEPLGHFLGDRDLLNRRGRLVVLSFFEDLTDPFGQLLQEDKT